MTASVETMSSSPTTVKALTSARGVEAWHDNGSRRQIGRIARQHDVEPLIERTRERLEGAPSHDDRLSKRHVAEIAEIG